MFFDFSNLQFIKVATKASKTVIWVRFNPSSHIECFPLLVFSWEEETLAYLIETSLNSILVSSRIFFIK